MKGGAIGNTLYNNAAAYGRFMSYVRLFVGNFIAIIMVIIAMFLLSTPETYTQKAVATITTSTCRSVPAYDNKGNPKGETPSCSVAFQYMADNSPVRSSTTFTDKYYNVGDTFNLRYNPIHPEDWTNGFNKKYIAFFLLGFGILIAIGVWVSWYIATHYQFAAAATGVGNAYGIIKNVSQ